MGAVQCWQKADGSSLQEEGVLGSPRCEGGRGVGWFPMGVGWVGQQVCLAPAPGFPRSPSQPTRTCLSEVLLQNFKRKHDHLVKSRDWEPDVLGTAPSTVQAQGGGGSCGGEGGPRSFSAWSSASTGCCGAELLARSLPRVSPSPLSGDGSGGSRCWWLPPAGPRNWGTICRVRCCWHVGEILCSKFTEKVKPLITGVQLV